jgi:haloalkane dehalogenase
VTADRSTTGQGECEVAFDGFSRRDVPVSGSSMHIVEAGTGRPVVFLHGNPTSSHLWRHVLPPLSQTGRRLIAVDLIGMGRSGKPAIEYTLRDHVDFLTALLDTLGLTDIVFVAHDWGTAICLEYLRRRPDRVRAVAFMEGHVRPLDGWADIDPVFQRLRTAGEGERLALEENFLIETLLPAGVRGALAPGDLEVYRRPYPDPASRRPLLQWTRQIPVAGQPADAARILEQAWTHFAALPRPKLLVRGRPGAVIGTEAVAWCRRTAPDLRVADIGAAGHFLPEDQPVRLAQALTAWLDVLE